MHRKNIIHSLRFKVFAAVGILLAAFIIIFFAIINVTMPAMLMQAEQKYLTEQMGGISHSFESANEELMRTTGDFGYWSETALFAEGQNPDFISDNWAYESLEEVYNVNFIIIKDIDESDRYIRFCDYINGEELPVPDGLSEYLNRFSAEVEEKFSGIDMQGVDYNLIGAGGIVFYDGVPYSIAVMPVMGTQDNAPLSGTVIMGRALTNEYFQHLTNFTSMTFELLPGSGGEALEIRQRDSDTVDALLPLHDIDGNDVALIVSDVRAVYNAGMENIVTTVILLLIAVVAFIVVLYLVIVNFVIKPVEVLTKEIKNISLGNRVELEGYSKNTEFESLKSSINGMLEGLDESNVSVNILYNILNSMDANLYVTDPETDEILFINDEMRKHFHIEGEAAGQVCWKVLQSGMDARCDFCPVYELMKNPGATVTWEEHNTLTGRYYKNTDRLIEWSDNRTAHVQHSVDITDIKLAGQKLKKQLDQQVFMSDISAGFISTDDMPTLIKRALRMTGEFMSAGKIIIASLSADNKSLAYRFGWKSSRTENAEIYKTALPFTPGNFFYDAFVTGQKTYIACDDASTNDEYAVLAKMGVISFLTVPILVGGDFWGIINVDNSMDKQHWEKGDITLLKLISSVISSVIKREEMERSIIAAKEQAEQASQAKGDFLSRMSHEMRTPMNAIIGMTSIALASDDPERKEYCLGKIQEASNHLLGVINDILDMSKIEANKFELSYTDFVFEKMLMKVTNVIGFRVEEKKQNFVVNVDSGMPYSIVSDEQHLSQVLTNLLTNAVKFTPEHGNITLDVKLVSSDSGSLELEMRVKDDGIGISEENQKRLFQSFEQADGSISRQYGGTGLGLAISKNIVEMMGGRIWAESTLGEGSVFAFTVKAEAGNQKKPANARKLMDLKNLRVLAVDDSAEVRDYFEGIADILGFACDVAEDGYAARDMIAAHESDPYDVIFVDWRMPGMNGVELAREIKKLLGDKAVIIMISATEWSAIENEARSAGVTRYIQKPLFPSMIVDAINESLGGVSKNDRKGPDTSDEDGIFDGFRALLAEDYEVNQEILKALLEHTGIIIDTAENGEVALDMYKADEDAYDLIFMDIHMPKMDGYEATRRIRAMDSVKARSIPIIAMTANVFKEDIEKCLAAGMDDHVGKPIDTEEVIEKMRKYLPDKK